MALVESQAPSWRCGGDFVHRSSMWNQLLGSISFPRDQLACLSVCKSAITPRLDQQWVIISYGTAVVEYIVAVKFGRPDRFSMWNQLSGSIRLPRDQHACLSVSQQWSSAHTALQ